MGTVYEIITLKNASDVADAERGIIAEEEVRETTVNALVDTGSGTLVISEEIREKLGLRIPLEDMDLMVNPVKRELVGVHGDEIVCLLK